MPFSVQRGIDACMSRTRKGENVVAESKRACIRPLYRLMTDVGACANLPGFPAIAN
jgi:hypothetical protein